MSKINIEFKDRIVEFPNRYSLTDNGDGTYTLTPFPGEITEEGTPINAANMNEIVQKHNELYDEVVPRLFSIPKRDVEGNIIYTLLNSRDEIQNEFWGDLTNEWDFTKNFEPVTIQPSHRKRFLRIDAAFCIYYGGSAAGYEITKREAVLKNLTSDIVLKEWTGSTIEKMTSNPEIDTPKYTVLYETVIEAGQTVSFGISVSYSGKKTSHGGGVFGAGVILKDFRVFAEDVEFVL